MSTNNTESRAQRLAKLTQAAKPVIKDVPVDVAPAPAPASEVEVSPEGIKALLAKLDAAKAELARLQAEAEKPARKAPGFTCRVSQKGALSVYGFGHYPVTLYRSQWERFLTDANVQMVRDFIVAHAAELKEKGQ